MKFLFLALTTLLFLGVSAKSESVPRYQIVSSVFSNNIEEGKCLVKGTAKEMESKTPLYFGKVSNLSRTISTITNEKGEYSLTIDESDSVLYFFLEGYEEIVMYPYQFKNRNIVTIEFTPYQSTMMIMEEKPVIYCYSDEVINATLKLELKGELTFAYPKLNDNEWDVEVNLDGTITDITDNRTYPYLFWEAKQSDLKFNSNNDVITGELVEQKNVVIYLENALSQLGLNSTEKTDFITYWAPRLIKNEVSLIQFLIDDDVTETLGELRITPTPDSFRRVYLLFQDASIMGGEFALKKPVFKSFNRNRFTVLEWGGSELNLIESNL